MPETELWAPGAWDLRAGGVATVEEAGDRRTLIGYAIVFNSKSEVMSAWQPGIRAPSGVNYFQEIFAPSAVDRTLRAGWDLLAVYAHKDDQLLGRMSSGTLRARKDSHGLRVEIDLPRSRRDLAELVDRRDLKGMSFAYRAVEPGGTSWDLRSDPPVLTVTDAVLREVSVVAAPAYPQTELAARSLEAALAAQGIRGRMSADELLRVAAERAARW